MVQLKHGNIGFVLIMTLFLFSCNNIKKEYYEDGSLQSEVPYQNDQIHGRAVWYDQKGNKMMEAHYDQGKLNGSLIRYYENGNKEALEYYKHDLKDSISVNWNALGQKISEVFYKDDILHGSYKKWYENGQLQVEGQYHMGDFGGRWMYYDLTGNIVGIGDFKKGEGSQKGYYPDGTLKREISYVDNMKQGPEHHYNPQGEKVKTVIYDQGEVVEVITY
ncbi:MAG: hypothetical protein K9G67_09280 [Bacteroidales bacterium]|nr:hypothetical protein [Bacteroidales bacterium]MCF8345148.1 hypothetical protein [Bacteroidales bacterium]MCF8350645.1 hypothetical protein [Bacteroidales bacterium]MCF8376533.1 hypothetical protein [Bacteroidales bacterium]MCF8400615.1 hypothetical protein [Bacteroidales bacterium]